MEKTEKIGLGVATAGHVLLFGVLSVGFLATPEPLKLARPPIDVQFVDKVAMETAAPVVSTEEMAASQAPEVGPTEEASAPPEPTPTPPAPETPAPPPPPPRPSPPAREVERARPKPSPAPPKRADAKPSPRKPAPEAPPTQRSRPDRQKPATPATKTPAKPAEKPKPARGSRLGGDFLKGIDTETPSQSTSRTPPAAKMSAAQVSSLNAEIYRQLKPYWKPPSGADAEQLRTALSVRLNPDGSLAGAPEVVETTGVTDSNSSQVKLHQERAVQAVRRAAPFANLPKEFYEQWKWLKPLNFDGRLSR